MAIPASLMATHMLVNIHIFDEPVQAALVRKDLKVDEIIKEIIQEFEEDAELDPDGEYDLTLHPIGDTSQPNIPFEITLLNGMENNIPDLYFGWKIKRKLSFFLVEEGIHITPELFPTIIGRSESKVADVLQKIGVNLSASINSKTVSREHGVLREEDGQYFIETSPDKQPIVLNGTALLPGEKGEIKAGDQVVIGSIALEVEIQ